MVGLTRIEIDALTSVKAMYPLVKENTKLRVKELELKEKEIELLEQKNKQLGETINLLKIQVL